MRVFFFFLRAFGWFVSWRWVCVVVFFFNLVAHFDLPNVGERGHAWNINLLLLLLLRSESYPCLSPHFGGSNSYRWFFDTYISGRILRVFLMHVCITESRGSSSRGTMRVFPRLLLYC
jgi:hypothetical protein